MSVRCAVCEGRLELVRTTREDTYRYDIVEIEHWRCPAPDCRAGGHRARDIEADGDTGRIVHVAGPALDYAPPEVSD